MLIEHLSNALNIKRPLTRKQLKDYDGSGSRSRHQQILCSYLGVQVFSAKSQSWLDEVAETAATTKEMLADIINVMLEELVRNHFELPGFTVLKRAARAARNRVNEQCYRIVCDNLSDDAKRNELLAPSAEAYSAWHTLKREPKKPGNKEVRSYLQHVNWLQILGGTLPDIDIPVFKYRHSSRPNKRG